MLSLSLSLYRAWRSRQRPGRFPRARAHTQFAGCPSVPPREFSPEGLGCREQLANPECSQFPLLLRNNNRLQSDYDSVLETVHLTGTPLVAKRAFK